MPYIGEDRRNALRVRAYPKTPGELNFVLANALDDYLLNAIPDDEEHLRYTSINEVVGVLECLKLEIYRRIAVPVEKRKCRENGDVFFCLSEDDRRGTCQ